MTTSALLQIGIILVLTGLIALLIWLHCLKAVRSTCEDWRGVGKILRR